MAEGTLDTTFDTRPKGAVNSLEAVAIQSDGKLVISGLFFTTEYHAGTLLVLI